MSEGGGVEALRTASERLEHIAAELADPATADARAVELAREAAQIAGDAGSTVAEAAREAAERGSDES